MSLKSFEVDDLYEDDEIKELAKLVLPDPTLLDFYNRLSRREIWINTFIDDACVEHAKQIIDWNFKDKGIPIEQRVKIKIFLHTDGGDTTAMNALIDAITLSKTPCATIAMEKSLVLVL